jgi:5'-deoxynucleotidase YfbR-like HD superfamily hydrolase
MKTKKKSSIEVSKNSENEDIKLSNRIIDLFIRYQIEDSNAWLRALENQVKFLEERRKQLFDNLDMCLFKFQKKKINEELEQIEKELFKQYEKIGEEVDILNKLKNAISNNNDITEVDDDTLLSYYDLLT